MRFNNPWFSPPGFLFTAVILLLIGFAIRRTGHLMFSPGALSGLEGNNPPLNGFSTHAAFEEDCQACHQPLKHSQDELCTECHLSTLEQLQNQSGTHGKLPTSVECSSCHQDHRGRDFDLLEPALEKFDHTRTTFSLIHHQINFDTTPMKCSNCHANREFTGETRVCMECHEAEGRFNLNDHSQDFGDSCLACHDGQDRMLPFDHQETRFPLEGQHRNITCTACHERLEFNLPSQTCDGCHKEPAVHAGLFDPECAICHTPEAWSPVIFNGETFSHSENTRFNLVLHGQDFSGNPLFCGSCHDGDYQDFAISTCVACHAEDDAQFMNAHEEKFGAGCLDCHDGVDRMHEFDHANVFVLEGRHEEIVCSSCHENQDWVGLSTNCVDCHAEPEIHFGLFGLECEYCHNSRAWAPAQLKFHIFPLDHGEKAANDCTACHLDTYVDYTCYGCHEHQPEDIFEEHTEAGILAADIPLCQDCHPIGNVEEDKE
jgi:hypothetical protein